MLLIRVGVLLLAAGIVCGAVQRNKCLFQCISGKPQCGYNGKCKFKFDSLCELDFYNCRYGSHLKIFYPVWDDVCHNPKFTTCNGFYDTTKHTYFPVP